MKTILPLNITGYELKDLSKESIEKVLNEHISFWIDSRVYNHENKGNYEKAVDKAESMNTPWFLPEYIYDYCKDELILDIQINDYLFNKDGDLLPITYHINKDGNVNKITYSLLRNTEIEVTIA